MRAQPQSTNVVSGGKWFWFILILAVVGLVAGALLWLPKADNLEIDGVPFRTWVGQHPDFQIQDPLARVGTNAIPSLIRILREPAESAGSYRVKAWIWKHLPATLMARFYRWCPVPQWQLKRTALFGLLALGPEAKAALPEVLRVGRSETNRMVQASALAAALAIAPETPDTFLFWREQWDGTNYSRHDLAIYLRSSRYPIKAAAPLLLEEAKRDPRPVTILEAFEFLGDAARPAVPYMLKVFRDGAYSGNMMKVLRRLGPVASEAAPDMATLLADENPSTWALEVLKSIGPAAQSALPQVQVLVTNHDLTIRMLAAATSARIRNKPGLAVPVLMDGLEKPLFGTTKTYITVDIRQPIGEIATAGPEAAAILLGECGPAAKAALPILEEKLQDKNRNLRLACAQACWRISGTPDKALPVLLNILNSQGEPKQNQFPVNNYTFVRAIEAIGEMGPAAKSAIPALMRVRTFSMAARNAVNSALSSVNAGP